MAKQPVFSVFRPGLFDGKVAIVTGGGTGIGASITQELLYLGCNVMIASRKIDRLAKSAEEIRRLIPRGSTARLEFIQCNIRKEQEVKALVEYTLQKFGKIDYLVNNGGGQFGSPTEKLSLKGWNAVIETNLTGTFLMSREVYNQWMNKNGGIIVNMIVDMWRGYPGMSHTGASRAGVDNLTKSCSLEWAPSGVRVNAVAPGSSIYSDSVAEYYGNPNIFQEKLPAIPAKRTGTTEEVSACVLFLLSPAAAFITGETIKIDGAHSLWSTPGVWEVPDHKKLPAYSWREDIKSARQKSKL